MEQNPGTVAELAAQLRSAGCVYAEDEGAILLQAATSPRELARMLALRVQGFPLEHIVGWAQFYGLRISVAPGVFVPRRRSEFLVEQARAALAEQAAAGGESGRLRTRHPVQLLDLCCGSGAVGAALAHALAKEPNRAGSDVHAADVDPAAVACAAKNLAPFSGQVYCGDLFAAVPDRLRGSFDLIIANAPYVPSGSLVFMPREARDHEPDTALNGGVDGLDLHRRIAARALQWLRPEGLLLLESSVRQAPATADIMAANGFLARISTSEELDGTVVTGRLP